MKKRRYIISFLFLVMFIFLLTGCSKEKTEDGLILKTYKNESEKIVLNKETLKFIDVDFEDIFETTAYSILSNEYGVELNNLSQEEIQEKINNYKDILINDTALKNNNEYNYTFDKTLNTINITNNNYSFILTVNFTKNNMTLSLAHKEFK